MSQASPDAVGAAAVSDRRGWFDRLFLRPLDPRPLGIVRIAIAAQCLVSVLQITPFRIGAAPTRVGAIPAELTEPVLISWPVFMGGSPSDTAITILRLALAPLLLLLLVGWKTRPVTVVSCLLWLCYAGVQQSFGRLTALSSCFHLAFLLGVGSDWGDAYSIDARRAGSRPRPSWRYGFTASLLYFELGVFYLATAIAKLRFTMGWLVGDHLRNNIIDLSYFARDFGAGESFLASAAPPAGFPLAAILIAHPMLARMLSIGSVAFESTFLASFFVPRLQPLFLLGGIAFHVSIYLTVGIPPLPVLPMYLAGAGACVWRWRNAA